MDTPAKRAVRIFLTTGISPDANTETRRLLHFHRLAVLVFLWVAPMFAALGMVHSVHSLSLLMLGTVVVYAVALVLTLRGHHTLSKVQLRDHRRDRCTVLFCDIVGFTPLSETLRPHELVEMLDELFSRFDALAKRYGLEKIKTIGDAYMVAGGLPLPCDDHAIRVAHMALEMQEEAKGFERLDTPLGLRIGFHSGAVVAGVIGRTKFAYDLWGDTVNTASRMESEGVVGKIQVSTATRGLLEDEFEFAARGSIAIKGKGDMQTHFLLGPRRQPTET